MMKILFTGAQKTGKTYTAKRFSGACEEFVRYTPTVGVEVRNAVKGDKHLNIWDVAGRYEYGSMRNCAYIGGEKAVLFFNSLSTLEELRIFIHEVRKACPDIPLILMRRTGEDIRRSTVQRFIQEMGISVYCKSFKQLKEALFT